MRGSSRKVGILIIEDVDRLSRDQEHLQHMAKLLRANEVTLHAVAIGPVDNLVLSLKGMVAEEQRRRTAYQTRHGLKDKANRAGATGGKTLGYERVVIGQDSKGGEIDRYAIIEPEAALVRRIFTLYDEGLSLKAICSILDSEGVRPPSANWRRRNKTGHWNPSSLSGNIKRGEGILNNRAYIGERIFNRRRWVEVPNDRRGFSRQPRLNDAAEWIVGEDPEQRIIEQDLWDRVKARQQDARAARDEKFKLTANPLAGAKRPKHLLTDLVTCGACGEKFIATGAGRWRCRGHRAGGCTNGSVTTAELEERVLAGVRERLLTPGLVERFAAELQHELDAAHSTSGLERQRIEVQLVDTRNRIAKLVQRLEEDDDLPQTVVRRLKDLEIAEARLVQEVAAVPELVEVQLPANYEAVYHEAVSELDTHLTSAEGGSAREVIRALVEQIVVQPGSARGGKRRPMQLHGAFFGMLAFAQAASKSGGKALNAQLPRTVRSREVVIPLVAGTRFHLNLRASSEPRRAGAMLSFGSFRELFAAVA